MRVLTLVTQKGGTGKSTLSTGLAVAAMQAGESVIALDLDPQGTLAAWAGMREADEPSIAQLPPRETARLADVLKEAGKKFTLAILDTAGADSPATHNAMSAATLCLVPLRPTRPDGLAIKPTVEALIRGQRPFAFVLNQCPTQPKNSRASEMAAGLASLGLLAKPMVRQRADYQDAFAAGQGVTEYAPDGKAADEMRELWAWIDRQMKDKKS
ncbi:nucleotide-binding protein [Lichenifustis flavocetrariae]|uniref:AAA family ATPase n=1 Tax=Lichenifustis flavocetrariae TaxID=2949735 RepID=A0AA41Z8I3_9HYPH|nr:AAA family ATPase [Lichenifustis flavocetrariae]MCW6511307.1 AAA family ATPase [Lichenifustis flavocetrariae]